jgi:glutathione S-transferase
MLRLVIGNRRYSSWSLRPWLMLRHLDIAFEETVIPLRTDATRALILAHSPAGKVPVLIDGDAVVWESLAIIDHLADCFGAAKVWPGDAAARAHARAHARAVSAEMHGGFAALRRDCPFNMTRPVRRHIPSPDGLADAARIDAIWTGARERFGRHGAGPYLFGAFSAADAMFAPVVNRFHIYDLPCSDVSRAYMEAIMSLPAWTEWRQAAEAETWLIAESEVP